MKSLRGGLLQCAKPNIKKINHKGSHMMILFRTLLIAVLVLALIPPDNAVAQQATHTRRISTYTVAIMPRSSGKRIPHVKLANDGSSLLLLPEDSVNTDVLLRLMTMASQLDRTEQKPSHSSGGLLLRSGHNEANVATAKRSKRSVQNSEQTLARLRSAPARNFDQYGMLRSIDIKVAQPTSGSIDRSDFGKKLSDFAKNTPKKN